MTLAAATGEGEPQFGEGDVMTQMMRETSGASSDKPSRSVIASLVVMREFWGAVAIVAMWLAVLFDGIYGADLVSADVTTSTRIPSVLFVALFAALATAAVAKRAFGRAAPRE